MQLNGAKDPFLRKPWYKNSNLNLNFEEVQIRLYFKSKLSFGSQYFLLFNL